VKHTLTWFVVMTTGLFTATLVQAEVQVAVSRNRDSAGGEFKFDKVPAPARDDAAARARFTIVTGTRDPNGADVDALNDGRLPEEEDQPGRNFFFDAGTPGGRLLLDLGAVIEVKRINTFSWHPGPRGPQVYKLYAADGTADGFKAEPPAGTDPATVGWKLLAAVDTRPEGDPGGQYGVSISDSAGALGKFRYLLFDVSRTDDTDVFGNTFFSEIDVLSDDRPLPAPADSPRRDRARDRGRSEEGVRPGDPAFEAVIDASEAPELKKWIDARLKPAIDAWYPKIMQMLPSEGYTAPRRFTVTFRNNYRGVAATGGTNVTCSVNWFKNNLEGEAVGAVIHELVHVVQQYRGRGNPGWLVEGVADYIRWFKFEPASLRPRPNPDRAKYTDSYRTTAAFLEYVTTHHDHELVVKMNAAMRQGRYSPDLWKEYTGKTVDELWELYVQTLREGKAGQAAAPAAGGESAGAAAHNTLTEEERRAGWKLLFDGQSLNGWHNFKRDGVRPGWQVKDGTLACVDPRNAGDIVTTGKFDWFELTLEYNIAKGGNSGIIYHVTDEEGAVWATGPEIQLQDNEHAHDPQLCGWLYGLYQPPDDPKTGKPIDATRPAGQWNQIRVIIAPDKCEHYVNGVKYLEYVLGSEDFKARVARSKFGPMERFAKSDSGYLALQGDHGQVAFRNIKIRPLRPQK